MECAVTKNSFDGVIECSHSDSQRCFESIYVTDELRFAHQRQKYQILTVRFVFFYPNYRFDLFQPLLGLFGKKKICATG
jgi:hypothetical protein